MIEFKKIGTYYTFEDLQRIMAILRSDEGCPWDKEQNHESIADSAIEEAYELLHAIRTKDDENIKEELGDILLQVAFHAQMGQEDKRFTMDEVVDGICTKLIHRHPHVFGDSKVETADQVLTNWDAIKLNEKAIQTATEDLRQVPVSFPALRRAHKIQKKAAKVGFEFPDITYVIDKLHEELAELFEAMESDNESHIEEEFGDLLFSMVNLSRFLGINPENALTNAIEKFINRFEGVEDLAKARNQRLQGMSIEELDKLWDEVKKD